MIWRTKYRYKILRGRVAERDQWTIHGAVSPGHIDLLVSAPPALSPLKIDAVDQRAKQPVPAGGIPSWESVTGDNICGRAAFLCDGGAVDQATIKAYIESQQWDEDDQGFKITATTKP
jgi:putative transposase